MKSMPLSPQAVEKVIPTSMPASFNIPPFKPHRLVPGGHAQTLAGAYLHSAKNDYQAVAYHVGLEDGDTLVLHDDCPATWQPGDDIALLMHGLAGCHLSPYMIRISQKLNVRGVRTFRLDHRGCGAGRGLAKLPYHAGRSDDARAAVDFLEVLCPDSAIGLAGFSLSGNIVLKYLGENPAAVSPQISRAVSVNPPVDLVEGVRFLERPISRRYDRFFVKLLYRNLLEDHKRFNDSLEIPIERLPKGLFEFDNVYTAPISGYGTALNYYEQCSGKNFVSDIRVPTLILTAADDPIVPANIFSELDLPHNVLLHVSEAGGHLGYVARRNGDPDRRWMDWRVVDWLTAPSHA